MITKTFVINLERRTDKRFHMEKMFDALAKNNVKLNHVFFPAVDGADPQMLLKYQFTIPNWTDPSSGKYMTNGEIGCALSHHMVWSTIVQEVATNILPSDCMILILEDDVVITDNFTQNLELYLSETTINFDMLYVHRKPLDFDTEIAVSAHLNRPQRSYWTCGYILTPIGAQKLINAPYLNNLIPVDEFLPIMYGHNAFGYEKLFATYPKLECLATVPSLLSLTSNAFADSETYNSSPADANVFSKANHDHYDNNVVIYVGPTTTYNYQRFVEYGNIYGIRQHIINDKNIVPDILDYAKTFFTEMNGTLATIIIVDSLDDCHIIPVAPSKFVKKYYDEMTSRPDQIVVANSTKYRKNKLMLCMQMITLIDIIEKFTVVSTINDFGSNFSVYLESVNPTCTVVDSTGDIFYELDATNKIDFLHTKSVAINAETKRRPCFIYANLGKYLLDLNRVENYTGNGWNEYYGCRLPLEILDLPTVYISINIGRNTNAVNIIDKLDYPKKLIRVQINKLADYKSEDDIYVMDFDKFLDSGCTYYFNIGLSCVVDNPLILKKLLSLKKDCVAPMMLRRSDQWSNFWGDLSENGGYKRSFDYMDIVYHRRRGYWNVPYITGVVLIHRKIIHNLPRILTDNNWLDLDMRICHNLRECGIPMYVCNLEEYGWIIEDETNIPIPVQVLSRSVDLYDVVVRREEWEAKYLHPNYYQYRHNLTNMPYTELCPDIYNFPLFSHAFCTELIDIVEKYGKWSAGKNTHSDPRLGHNYYENYPTVDIQLFEVGLDRQWHEIVFTYIAPVAKIVYSSYKTKDINLAFVVKYTADNQASLDPHHDASTYTVNIALNESGTWYSGGGCRFIRQNYTLQNQLVGMCCMHPGRLTAYHEGLPVSHGTRYILVSFIN